MLNQPERACLVIADISGYTSYLAGTELDHAQDVLADLLEVVIGRFQPVLRLAKLEGDAVFTYAPEADLDGSMLLDVLESTYFSFQRRVQSITRGTTCRCNACVLIPRLNLKFCVHDGSFVRQRIAGQEELAGRDVILVHRLLKNSVSETRGLQGYALLTTATVEALKIDPAAAGMSPHLETYEHIGEVPGYVHDLEARWRQAQEARREFLRAEDADFSVTAEIPGPPPLAWEYLTTPAGYSDVSPDITRREQHGQGRRGVGSTTHCMHGDGSSHMEEIMEWRPFEDFTYLIKDPEMGQMRVTVEVTPTDLGTHIRYSVRMESPEVRAMMADPQQGPMLEESGKQYVALLEQWFAGIKEAVGKEMAERRAELEATDRTRQELQNTAAQYWQSRDQWVEAPAGSPSASTS
jgi:uncharacterized protein YndB with AHSA1/START domain